jgi:hypothetical protein
VPTEIDFVQRTWKPFCVLLMGYYNVLSYEAKFLKGSSETLRHLSYRCLSISSSVSVTSD